MNNVCYIHNDRATLRKDNILISKASATFSVCRCNNLIFKSSKCKKLCCNNTNKIHFYIKNCDCKNIKNLRIRITVNNCEVEYIDIGNLDACKDMIMNKEIIKCNCMPVKVYSELLIGEDVVKTSCLII